MKNLVTILCFAFCLSSCDEKQIQPDNSTSKIKGQGDTVGKIKGQSDTVGPINSGSGN